MPTPNVSNINIQSDSRFVFDINKLPEFSSSVISVNLPGLNVEPVSNVGSTPLSTISWEGDHVSFEKLSVDFLVYEGLKNWKEIYTWMMGLGFPEEFAQRKALKDGTDLDPSLAKKILGSKSMNHGHTYSQATLLILSSHQNVHTTINFVDVHPISLTQLKFTTQATDYTSMVCTVQFAYDRYTVETTT